jgi:hypothetical protein
MTAPKNHMFVDRHQNFLPAWQRKALVHLMTEGKQPFSRSIWGKRNSDPACYIAIVTAKALCANGLAIITKEYLSLTPKGRVYAMALVYVERGKVA